MIDEIEYLAIIAQKHFFKNDLFGNNWIITSIIFQSYNSLFVFRL